MRWGEPIIPTSITEITPEGPRYRGRSAVALARGGASFEAVAEGLWSGLWLDAPLRWEVLELPDPVLAQAAQWATFDSRDHLMEIFAVLVLQLGMARGSVAERLRKAEPSVAARQVIQSLVACTGLLGPERRFLPMHSADTVAAALLRNLGANAAPGVAAAVEAVLVLLADHELTGSTFAARLAASSGALLHGCIAAALATHSGIEIGRLHDRVEAFLAQPGGTEAAVERAKGLQAQGLTPPGFNHPLYPRGDPRAEVLLQLAAALPRRPERLKRLLEFLAIAEQRMQLHPRVETGVAAVCMGARLPPKSASALFTIARCAGWVAHVLEQRTAGFLLRPRAKYSAAGA
jgi:citrate synthase